MLATMEDVPAAGAFFTTLNNCHPSIAFTIEVACNVMLTFVGMGVLKKGCKVETSVYRKPSNTGLLFQQQSHVGKRYKKSLVQKKHGIPLRLNVNVWSRCLQLSLTSSLRWLLKILMIHCSSTNIREFKQLRRRWRRQRQKKNWFYEQTTALYVHHAFWNVLVHFFDVHSTTTTWNLPMRRFVENVDIGRQIFLSLFEHG